jgi:hypothetical protein
MIRSSPCDFYLKYLITHPDNYTDAGIRGLVKLQRLDFLGYTHLERLRKHCAPPAPFYPDDPDHAPSARFLTKERIYSLYHYKGDDDVVKAIELLDHPRGKEMTEQMLVAGADPGWICVMLRRVHFHANPRTIEVYKHFYFNIDLVDATELRAIMMMRANLDQESGDADHTAFRAAYERSAKADINSLTGVSSLAPFARVLNMMRLGIMPSSVQISRIATIARLAATVRSAENSLLGHAERARDFALTAKIMNELMESVGDVSGDLQRSLMGMTLDTDTAAVPSIEQLTQGNHTVDMLPVLTEGVEAAPNVEK